MAVSQEAKWLQRLQSFLIELLAPLQLNKKTLDQMVSPDNMKIWSDAFTHETVSPTDNYEDLEYIGDGILKAAFPKLLRMKFPYFHKGEYTELNVNYMSGVQQGIIARNLGMGEFIRVHGLDRATFNLESDVFESFFGALDTVSDNVNPGSGFNNCFNMIVHMFEHIDFNEKRKKGAAKTQVIQMFTRFDLPKPEEISTGSELTIEASGSLIEALNKVGVHDPVIGISNACKDKEAENKAYKQVINLLEETGLVIINRERVCKKGENIDFGVKLEPVHVDFLKKYFKVDFKNPIIGRAQAPTKKEAEFEAYSQALDVLETNRITSADAKELKRKLDLLNPSVYPYLQKAYERLQKEGYKDMSFFLPKKTITPKGAIIELIGIRPDGKEEAIAYLYTSDREKGYINAKATLVSQYGSGKQF